MKVPIKPEDRLKSYYKYYEQGIVSPTPEIMEMVAKSKGTAEEAIEAADMNNFLSLERLPAGTGYYPLKAGGLLVAGNIPMPGVTADMLWWWFAWHGLEPFRYSIWDPEDHFSVAINEEGRRRALDPNIPLKEKTWGATHTVVEAIGETPDEITIMFKNPTDMGLDASKIGTKEIPFLVCANGLMGPMKIPSVLVEAAMPMDGGLEFRARFWMGYQVIDGKPKYLLPPDVVLPDDAGMGLLAHNLKEFPNLAKILPSVYAEEKDNW